MTRRVKPDAPYVVRNTSREIDPRDERLIDELSEFGEAHGLAGDDDLAIDIVRGRVNALDPRRQ